MAFLDGTGLAHLIAKIKAAFVAQEDTVEVDGVSIDSTPTANSTNLVESGGVHDFVKANPTVPAGTTPTSLSGLKIGSNYYEVAAGGGGGTVTDVTVGGTSVVNGSGVAVVPAIPTVEALTTSEIDTIIAAVV